jgi:multidrug efflux pump subunit AcrA (membrane-fusion protein)
MYVVALVGSGLVLRVREELGDRYQVVHDYLVEPIRQKNYGIVAELKKIKLEKTKAEVAQKLSQQQLNLVLQRRLREARIAGVVLSIMGGIIAALWWQADLHKRAAISQTLRAERSETNLKISAIALSNSGGEMVLYSKLSPPMTVGYWVLALVPLMSC